MDNSQRLYKTHRQRPISVKLLIATWAISSLASLFFTAVQLVSDYNRDYKKMTSNFDIVEKSYLQPLSEHLWSYDNRLIEIQLDGLTRLDGVSYIRLRDLSREIYSKGISHSAINASRSFKVYHTESRELLGTLDVEVDTDSLRYKYLNNIFWIFIRQATKTMIVVFVLFFAFNQILVAPIEQISRYLRRPEADKAEPLTLKRSLNGYYDELDLLVDNINEYSELNKQRISSLTNLTAGITNEISPSMDSISRSTELLKASITELATSNVGEQGQQTITELNAISTELQKSTNRIQNILKTIQMFTVNTNSNFSIVDIEQMAIEALRNTKIKLEESSIVDTTKVSIDIPEIKIRTQKRPFIVALENILENSFYSLSLKQNELGDSFTPEIKIHSELLKDKIRISIWDNGTGIGIESLDKIFNPFFSTKPAGEGTGLGLTIAFDIIRKQGGQLRLADTYKNEFTHVVIELPLSVQILYT